MVQNIYWAEAIEHLIMDGETESLSTEAIAVLNKLATRANPISGAANISLPMLSDLNAYSMDKTEKCIQELEEKNIIIRLKKGTSTDYALHHRLLMKSSLVETA